MWDHINLKSFLTAKETINKIKLVYEMGENIHKSSDKGLVLKTY